MGQEFSAKVFKAEFPHFVAGAIVGLGKDPAMDPAVESDKQADAATANAVERPHASDWLWRPWYAKLWWAAIVVYWLGMAASLKVALLDQFYTSALAGFLNIAFFPALALMVLGIGFARKWFAWSDWEFVEPTHEQMFPKRSVGGMRDPCADPLDPRSGALHWRRVDGGH
ncbi:MAG: hypothetical protein ACOY4P_04965 [Pseudomonadota bacterium]|jgi:hypothetical protein|tara:strand:+ start:888 stop:1397 length:510 start_codon:yes stop_codon:yes gene_type:complete